MVKAKNWTLSDMLPNVCTEKNWDNYKGGKEKVPKGR